MCVCHKLVCKEHVAHLRPFEEPSVGIIFSRCEMCGKEIKKGVEYVWIPIELFDRVMENNKR